MIPKFKRFYSENSSIGVPNPGTCVKLVEITAERISELEINDLQVKYILCKDKSNEEITVYIPSDSFLKYTLEINSCIKDNSLYIGGENITEEGVYETGNWSISVDFDICTAPEPVVTYSATRSVDSLVSPETGCEVLFPTVPVYISTSIPGQITSGDVAYSDSFGTVPFNGSNNYYALKLDTQVNKRICRIQSNGTINVYSFCF